MLINVNDNLIQSKKIIDSVNLNLVIDRLVLIEGWDKIEAIEACQQYRNFLYLKKKYEDQYELPPSKDMDDVWHAHILHTKDYIKFCDEVFGYYLHHNPHLVSNDEKPLTLDQLENMFSNQTQELYHKEFGSYIYTVRQPSLKEVILSSLKALCTRQKIMIFPPKEE